MTDTNTPDALFTGRSADGDGALVGTAFYNEIDPVAAQTIREAIARGLIAPGMVDERDIRDITPNELAGYTQVHLFAGGGIWSYALRSAGWPDDRPVWTCSCPCQPFSTAGKGGGFADERHLWPAAYWLISQRQPECIAGEQVADKGADPWIDLVQADMEAMGYAFGCVPLASAGFGAPNPRHRSYWMAHPAGVGCAGVGGSGQDRIAERGRYDWLGNAMRDGAAPSARDSNRPQGPADRGNRHLSRTSVAAGDAGTACRMANAPGSGLEGEAGFRSAGPGDERPATERVSGPLGVAHAGRLADERRRRRGEAFRTLGADGGQAQQWEWSGADDRDRGAVGDGDPRPTNGFWRDADWLLCRDPRGPRWRPVDAGTFPLAPGHPGRVEGLRISGNAINAEVATAFIEAMMDIPNPQETTYG